MNLENDDEAFWAYVEKYGIASNMKAPASDANVAYAKLREDAKRGFTTGEIEDTGNVGSHKLTQDAKKQILDLYADGLGIPEISTICKLHISQIESVLDEQANAGLSLANQVLQQLRNNQPEVIAVAGDDDVVATLGRKLSKVMNGK